MTREGIEIKKIIKEKRKRIISICAVIFLLMAIVFLISKNKILTPDGVKQMTEMLLMTVVPCVIIDAYQRDFDIGMVKNLGLALFFAALMHIICIVIAPLIFIDYFSCIIF